MGKLADLWAELKEQKDGARKEEIKQEISKIQDWMISQNFMKAEDKTNWNKPQNSKSSKKTFRFEAGRMGNHCIPEGALTGKAMCRACQWNKHSYCDKGKTKLCWANV